MNLSERIDLLEKLGNHLSQKDEFLEALMHRTFHNNQWFTIENQQLAIDAIVQQFLQKDKLLSWCKNYPVKEVPTLKKVGLIMAGNIPLVGFHDLLTTFVAGHQAIIKLSDKDKFIIPYLIQLLGKLDERALAFFEVVERLKNFDAVIATGSNNSARYFEAYFGKYPNIIRKNRNGIAVLKGNETKEEIRALGSDVFRFFGLGCRNVSKIYVPQDFSFDTLLGVWHENKSIILNHKYKNNFDYNYALLMINKEPFLANGCLILKEDKAIPSRIASLHYEYYSNEAELSRELVTQNDQIQCVIANSPLPEISTINFGEAQIPALADYADGVDTLQFLVELYD